MLGVWIEDGEIMCMCEESEECPNAHEKQCSTLIQIKKALTRLKQEIDVRGNEHLIVECANVECDRMFEQRKVSQKYCSDECRISAHYNTKKVKRKVKMTLVEKDAKIKELIADNKISYGKAVAIIDGYVGNFA